MRSGLGLARPLRAAGPKGAKARQAVLRHGHHPGRPRGLPARFEGRHRSRRAGRQQRCLRRLPWQASCVPHRGRPGRSGGHSRRASGCGGRPGRLESRQSISSRSVMSRDSRARGDASHEYATTGLPAGRPPGPLPLHPRMYDRGL